jgi:hypothetical protein
MFRVRVQGSGFRYCAPGRGSGFWFYGLGRNGQGSRVNLRVLIVEMNDEASNDVVVLRRIILARHLYQVLRVEG